MDDEISPFFETTEYTNILGGSSKTTYVAIIIIIIIIYLLYVNYFQKCDSNENYDDDKSYVEEQVEILKKKQNRNLDSAST
jgi:uncharacterized protein YxeA